MIFPKITLVTALLCMSFLTVVLSGCTIDDSLNDSPNDILDESLATQEGVYGLLVGVQTFTGDFYTSDRSRVVSMWTWQMSAPPGLGRAQPESWDNYILDETGPPNDLWLYGYKTVRIADDIMKYTPLVVFSVDPLENTAIRNMNTGIAKTCKALCLGEMAALFGSIPIDIPRDADLTPAQFVDQATAYAAVQSLLDEALTEVTTVAYPEDYDLNFSGDADKWKELIHSLKARYYLHARDYANALLHADQGMKAGGSWNAVYNDAIREYAPWGHWNNDEGTPLRPNKAFVDSLKSEAGDSRLAKYFNPNDSGKIVGYADPDRNQTATDPDEVAGDRVATMLIYSGYGDDFPMMSGAETILIRAEAKAEGGDISGAVTDVNLIRVAAGLTPFVSTDKDATIAQIMKQKWLELYLEGQDYHDFRRRTLLPQPVPNVPGSSGNIRIIYPLSERNSNPYTPSNNDALVKPLSGY